MLRLPRFLLLPCPQLASQTLHMLQLLPTGRLHYLHAIGPHCRVSWLLPCHVAHVLQLVHGFRRPEQQPILLRCSSAWAAVTARIF